MLAGPSASRAHLSCGQARTGSCQFVNGDANRIQTSAGPHSISDRARVLLEINNAIVSHLDLKWSACGSGVRASRTSETRGYECYTFAREQWNLPALTLRRQIFDLCECIRRTKWQH